MIALIISNEEYKKFPIPASSGGIWKPTNNTVGDVYWLQLEAKADLDRLNISYTIADIIIV